LRLTDPAWSGTVSVLERGLADVLNVCDQRSRCRRTGSANGARPIGIGDGMGVRRSGRSGAPQGSPRHQGVQRPGTAAEGDQRQEAASYGNVLVEMDRLVDVGEIGVE
jgi:hypothetical protein